MRVAFDLPVVVKSRVGRAFVERTVIATVPHVRELPDVSTSDAPLALAFRQSSTKFESVEYRAFAGKLWAACPVVIAENSRETYRISRYEASSSPFFGGRRSIESRIQTALDVAASSKRPPAQSLFPNAVIAYVADRLDTCQLESLVSLRLQGDIDGQVGQQIEAFERHLDGFAMIGGILHRTEVEPLLRLFPDGRFLSAMIERRGHASTPVRLSGHVPRSVGWFRMDDHSSLLDEAQAILVGMRSLDPLASRIERIEIYDQSMLSASPESIGVYDVADAMRRHFQSVMAADAPGEQQGSALMRWMATSSQRDVRYFKALSGKLRGESIQDELPADLEEAFMTMAESQPTEYVNYTGNGHLRVFLEEVARRWRDRPLTLAFPMSIGTLI